MNQSWVTRSLGGGVLTLTLTRIERKNAINQSMYKTLADELKAAAVDDDVRSVVFTGEGGCFTAGNDLQDFMTGVQADNQESPIAQFLWTYATFPKPIIVAVEGLAIGVGTTLLLHSDLAYATADSFFQLPFCSLGLCPEFASTYLLPRLVGYAKASEWLLLGERFSAQEALTAGLVNQVVDNPLLAAQSAAGRLAVMPPNAIRKSKALLKASLLPAVQKAMVSETEAFVELLQGAEFHEAVAAFFNKQGRKLS